MNSSINSILITSILAFTLIASWIPTAFVNVLAQQDGGNATQGQTGWNMTGLTQGQISQDGSNDNDDEGDDDNNDKDNGDDKDDKDDE